MTGQSLESALGEVRGLLLDRAHLVRAVAAGRRHGESPSVVRAEVRPVTLKAGPRMQVVTSDGIRPYTRNVDWDGDAAAAVDALLSRAVRELARRDNHGDAPAESDQEGRRPGAPVCAGSGSPPSA